MNLRARLNRLSSHRGIQGKRPEVTCIFIRGVYAVDRETGEVTGADTASAMVWTPDGWKTVIREDGEAEADFIARIDRMDSEGPSG
jgi:hypothetical protein